MPELPEVEVGRLIARRVAAGRVIAQVRCADDPIVFDGIAPARVRRALLGRRVSAVHRHGKHIWFALDQRPWLILHFGMTGGFHTPEGRGVKLVSSGDRDPDGAWPPRFTKLHLVFDHGGELVYADARRLGRVRLRHDPRHEPPISQLGFDAYREIPPPERFCELLRDRGAPLKAVLLDQAFAAGVGNWIADEVLYQARLDPRRRAHTPTRSRARSPPPRSPPRATHQPAGLRRVPGDPAPGAVLRAAARPRCAAQGRAPRPGVRRRRGQLDRRRGAVPGEARPAPPRAHPHPGGGRAAAGPVALGGRAVRACPVRQRPLPALLALSLPVGQARGGDDWTRRIDSLYHARWAHHGLGARGATLTWRAACRDRLAPPIIAASR